MIDPSQDMLTRRRWLRRAGGGFGLIGLAGLLQREGLLGGEGLAADASLNPMAVRPGHFAARARRVIWIFTNGGPSQVDTWEYKPGLERWHGRSMRAFDPSFKNTTGFFKDQVGALMKSPFRFTPRGDCGKMVSEIFPHLGRHVDKMAFLHSIHTESNNHSPALFMINTGFARMGYPCVGSWLTYGLGSEADNLPGFVVMSDPKGRGLPKGHAANWGAAFLPGVYQGTHLHPKGPPIDDLERPGGMTDATQRAQLAFLGRASKLHDERHAAEAELAARIHSYELAYRMQSAAPEAIGIDAEPESVKRLYGIGDPRCDHFARQCPRPGAWPSGASASSRSIPGAWRTSSRGTGTSTSRATTRASPPRPTGRSPACWRISRGADCWTRRWSSGAASSAACQSPRPARSPGGTTTRTGSPCGWPAAGSRAA
jgi:hypothetical protein